MNLFKKWVSCFRVPFHPSNENLVKHNIKLSPNMVSTSVVNVLHINQLHFFVWCIYKRLT